MKLHLVSVLKSCDELDRTEYLKKRVRLYRALPRLLADNNLSSGKCETLDVLVYSKFTTVMSMLSQLTEHQRSLPVFDDRLVDLTCKNMAASAPPPSRTSSTRSL